MAYKKKDLVGEGNYVLFYFNSEREKAKRLEEEVLNSISNQDLLGRRYLLLNLSSEGKPNKIKVRSKNVE